jgi:hypothetical protein
MTYRHPTPPIEPTGPDWPILLLIVAFGLMLWAPVVMLVTR